MIRYRARIFLIDVKFRFPVHYQLGVNQEQLGLNQEVVIRMKLMRMAVVTSAVAISLGFSAIFPVSSPGQAAQPVEEASTVKHDVVGEDFDAIARSLGISYNKQSSDTRVEPSLWWRWMLPRSIRLVPSRARVRLTGSSSERGIVSFVGAPTEKSLAALEELPYEVEVREGRDSKSGSTASRVRKAC